METELSFSQSILKDDCPVYFPMRRAIVTHPDRWKIVELRVGKSIHGHASFR